MDSNLLYSPPSSPSVSGPILFYISTDSNINQAFSNVHFIPHHKSLSSYSGETNNIVILFLKEKQILISKKKSTPNKHLRHILLEFSYKAISFSTIISILKIGAGFYLSLYLLSHRLASHIITLHTSNVHRTIEL